MRAVKFSLTQDRKGMIWDLLLYVPTVVALLSMAAKFWYGDDINLAYLLAFLASFFFIAGANRVLKTRLMLMPNSPVAIEADQRFARMTLRNGEHIELIDDLRFFTDYAGRTFGLTGNDKAGRRQQFVLHKGQFASPSDFEAVLAVFRKT